jgi:transmembrane sensor
MENTKELKYLALQYFSGSLPVNKEILLFDFISHSPSNLTLFREWEKEWIRSVQSDEEIKQEWIRFSDEKLYGRSGDGHGAWRTGRGADSGASGGSGRGADSGASGGSGRGTSVVTRRCADSGASAVVGAKGVRLLRRWALVAAVLVAAVVVSTFVVMRLPERYAPVNIVSVEAPYGEKSKIALADGSTIWINSGSKLSYVPSDNPHEQVVSLQGEGYFEIAHSTNRKFIVRTKAYDIEVVGTKFNVTAYHDDRHTTTTLLEGKVNLLYADKMLQLRPGESMAYDTTTNSFQKVDVSLRTANAWIHNAIIYDNITLSDLVVKLSRRYNVAIQIESDALAGKRFNIALRNDESIAEVMHAIEKILTVEVECFGRNYFIRMTNS